MSQEQKKTPPTLIFAVVALVLAVTIADLLLPLGIAVWVFYALPLGACLFARAPMLPLYVAGFATAFTACSTALEFEPLEGQALVVPWVAFANRGMYVATLWPLAFMVRALMLVRQATEREAWLRRTQAALLESLRGEFATAEVVERTLRGVVDAVSAEVGAAYLLELNELKRIATHAIEADAAPQKLAKGEGLLGQAAERGKLVVVNDVPPGFLRLEAGVGSGQPAHLAVLPLRAEGRTVGVLALGSMHPIGEVDREFLERISEPAAVSVRAAQYQARLEQLLEQSQRQTEELQSQQVELEAQQTELEASNEELNQTNAIMETQTLELERQRDELARAHQIAEKASRYKSEFLANMSHELRTPLNSALILARLLADNKEGNLDPDQIRSAETIFSAGNDLLALIDDILDLAKIEAGRVDVASEPVVIGRLTETLERAFEPVAAKRKLNFRINVAAGTPDRIVSDGRRLEQILKNLLSNAFKFTPRGEVELEIAPVGTDQIRFAVRDSGIGIAPDQQEVIFEAFRQADGTTSRKYGGTGLGLSISRELARLLGGELDVKSVVGAGSTFFFVLPREAVPGQAPAVEASPARTYESRVNQIDPTPTPGRAGRPMREAPPPFPDDREKLARPGRLILVVEDDTAFLRILYELAHELDFDCVVAQTADEGVKLAQELQPSGVLLDVGLPDTSGLSVLERLKRDPMTRHVPVHVVSASDNAQTALELGAIGYALKPVAREELVTAIKKLEDRHAREMRRVLLVEDDERQQESIRKLLASEDVELVAAGSVKAALEQLERSSFDCMVLDLSLPDGSGHELLEKMAEGTRYSFPPVIVYTGRELARVDEERLRAYSRSIIVKGARSPERLLDEVTLFLHRVESKLPIEQRRMLADARQREAVFDGKRVLVVEDDVRNVFALTRVLEPRGAKIEIGRNGREALEILARPQPVDLVLMDLMMPEMDGLTAIREIRKQERWKRLPIIALTAKAMADDREQALSAGANDYMSKPFDVDKLVSLCRVWLPR
jgi:CheY-like chemotaxis protein